MPRKPRFYLPEVPAHIVQRGNCRQAVFFSGEDYQAYLEWLQQGAERHGCAIHAWVLMTNHVHLLITPEARESVSRMIQYVGRHYVTYVNRRYGKSGTLWEGRHKGCLVQDERYLLTCMQYIELNPVRARMVSTPDGYRWSSYHANAQGKEDGILHHHPVFSALARHAADRGRAWRELVAMAIPQGQMDEIRATVQTGTPLGNDRFRKRIERTLMCSVGQGRRGRPAKLPEKGY